MSRRTEGIINKTDGSESHRGMKANEHIKTGSNSYEKMKTFKYLGPLLTNQNAIQEQIKCRLKEGNACYYSAQTLVF